MTRPLLIVIATVLILAAQSAVPPWFGGGAFSALAWADDDDDGDDDGGGDNDDDDGGGNDDDDDGGRGGFSGGGSPNDDDGGGVRRPSGPSGNIGNFFENLFGLPRQPTPSPAAPPPPVSGPPPPVSAPDEIVTLALSEADLNVLLGQGFTLLEERQLASLATVSRRLGIPPALSLEEARQTARSLSSGQDADFNHYYRSEQDTEADCTGGECLAAQLTDWPHGLPREVSCGPSAPIGMIDTGINEAHETFEGAQLELLRMGDDALEPSRAVHGTAIAALLVGQPDSRSPGLLPGSQLVAVDVFHRVGGDERADVFTLLEALDYLASEDVSIINLSLAGPSNSTLASVVRRLVSEIDIALVAAVGNDGPSAEPAYPAAYPEVIAVTAVDRRGTVYRRAITGPHVDFAAPGVEIWTAASVSGARWKTGTSFAVPFVTAAAAFLRERRPELLATEVEGALRATARDLGSAGPDDVYGAGLVELKTLCRDGQRD